MCVPVRSSRPGVAALLGCYGMRMTAGDFPVQVPESRARQRDHGRELRGATPRSALADTGSDADRDPIGILRAQNVDRLAELVPLRRERMSESPFAFYRGAAAVMAADLARTPRTGVEVQLCGDAHLSNFGLFAARDRDLIFDLNDFDETAPGPWEFDLKRLVTSVAILARQLGLGDVDEAEAAARTSLAYRIALSRFADMEAAERFFTRISAKRILKVLGRAGLDDDATSAATKTVRKAERNTSERALGKLTAIRADGVRRIVDQPPLTTRVAGWEGATADDLFRGYADTLDADAAALLSQFRVTDAVVKVVGVGSVGTRCLLVLTTNADEEALFLQIKEASASVLETHAGAGAEAEPGIRVVRGQRIMQASGDPFLGSLRADNGRSFYVRQFRDKKGGVDPMRLQGADQIAAYAGLCAVALARAHAQSGFAATISGYLGGRRGLGAADHALARFALAYADRNEADHAALVAASETDWYLPAGA